MRGVLTAVALALIITIAPALAATVGMNATYSVGDTTLLIQPMNTDGIRYFTATNLTKLWKVGDCKDFAYVTACLVSSTNTTATFTEEFIGAIVKQRTTLTPTTLTLGETASGEISLTNANSLPATKIRVQIDVTGPGTFADGSIHKELTGTVNTAWTIPFTVKSNAPGIVRTSGTVTYFDQNQTQVLPLDNRSFTVTVPFTLEVLYNNATARNKTTLRITLTRKTSEELEATISAALPPEANFGDLDRRVRRDKTTLIRSDTLVNDSKFNLTGAFSFSAPPSGPMQVTYRYTLANNSQQSYTMSYPFFGFDESEPSLGVRIDSTSANVSTAVRIIITGNVTGTLEVSGEYLEDVRIAGPGTYDLRTKPAPEGNYTIGLNFSWITAYGTPKFISGKAILEVRSAAFAQSTVPDGESIETPPVKAPTITLVTPEDIEGSDTVVWVIGGLAIGCLLGLVYVLHQLRSPIHRIETLLQKVAALHRAQAEKHGTLSHAKQAELATLEAELAELKRRL